jgi:23S rRNA (pseudouridine1915-N3)-methyltransferase
MLQLRILCAGRRAQDPLLDAADEYVKRLERFAKIELMRVREGDKQSEGKAMSALLRDGDWLVALDERGKQVTSRALAQSVAVWQDHGRVVLVIGGADGLADDLKARAKETLALSALTLPHRLALVVLCEQLYRAYTLLKHMPYHRD